MALVTKAIKGTKDVLPSEVHKNQYIEATCLSAAENCGYREMRTPVFEHTELFQRGVGDTTDVVQKEMYTFDDKGGRSITLRPEGTAGAARSFLENGLSNEALPQKICYLTSCYRYEKPQAGRLREFHQFGCEMVGSASPRADAEIIALAYSDFGILTATVSSPPEVTSGIIPLFFIIIVIFITYSYSKYMTSSKVTIPIIGLFELIFLCLKFWISFISIIELFLSRP